MPSKEGMDPPGSSIERITPSAVRINIPGDKKKVKERRKESRDRKDETKEEKQGKKERTKSITIDVPEDVDRRRMSMATERRRSTLGQIRPMSSGRLKSVLFKSKSALSVEEYSTSSSEDELDEKQPKKEKEKTKKKDKGKGKRGKKKQSIREKSEEKLTEEQQPPVVEPEPQKDDVMADIMKMKAAATGEDVAETAEKKPEMKAKKKQPPKKKKPKKVKMTAEMIEKMRIEAELEAARLEEMERKRLEEERKAAIEKEKREMGEHRLRLEQLNKTYSKLEDMVKNYKESTKREKDLAEWEFYIACERLPNPSLCDQMNTYLHLWDKEMSKTTMEEASNRTTDVVKLLEDLQDLLDTATDARQRTVDNWKWVRQLFRDHQKENLEVATYKLLRNIEKNLHRIDIPTADYHFADENLNLSIWLRVQLPIPLPNPRRPPKSRIDIDFPNVKLQVLFPASLDCDCMAVRAMYLKYDHLSDQCRNFCMPEEQHFSADLLGSVNREWRTKLMYKYDNRDKKEAPKVEENEEGAQSEEKEKTEFSSDEEIPTVPYKKLQPSASEMILQLEDLFYLGTKDMLTIAVPEHVVNLRKFSVLGGVFCLNLVYQPPQPQYFVTMDLQITKFLLPKKLEHVDFSVIYAPPRPPTPGTKRLPEQIEEEMKQQEEEMDKLMLITLTWPRHVIFLELPIVCHWDEKEEVWSKKNIHDLKHNEEKGILTFRTGLFGTYGLATIRYVNLPYQAWELKPEEDGSVTFQITAAILMLEFNVKDGLICLSQLQNSPNKALTEIIGQYFKLFKLKRKMKDAGIDVFPEPDAFCYIEGACQKHWPTEKHLYYNMAQMATCFNFAWSRWNLTLGRRSIVMQMRDYIPTKSKQKNHSMLLVTPQRASLIECTEVSQVFCDDEIEGLKFSADLYHLIKAAYSITVRKRAQTAPWQNVNALYELLMVVRVLSFS